MHATVPHSNSTKRSTRHYHVDSHHGTRHPAVCESGACRCCRELVALIGPRASIGARPPVRLDCVRLASENRRRAQRRARRVPCVHVLLFSDRASSALLPPPSKKNRAPTGRPERSSIIAPASDLCCPLALNRPPHWQHPEQNDHCITSTIAISHTATWQLRVLYHFCLNPPAVTNGSAARLRALGVSSSPDLSLEGLTCSAQCGASF